MQENQVCKERIIDFPTEVSSIHKRLEIEPGRNISDCFRKLWVLAIQIKGKTAIVEFFKISAIAKKNEPFLSGYKFTILPLSGTFLTIAKWFPWWRPLFAELSQRFASKSLIQRLPTAGGEAKLEAFLIPRKFAS